MDVSATVGTNQYGTTTITGQATALLGNKYGDVFNIQQATFLLSTTSIIEPKIGPSKVVRQNRVLAGGQQTLEIITTYDDSHILSQRGTSQQIELRWERCEDLGVGVFGEVHREEAQDGEKVKSRAVKVLRRRQLEHMQIDYKKELDALIQLSQPQYVRRYVEFFSWYEDQNYIYLAMEYIPYGDLARYIYEGLKEVDASQIAYQVLDGIRVMHRLDLIHRDIKPANIFVVQREPVWWVKIGDFGISKSTITKQTSLHTQVGTQGYQAPEVLGLVATKKRNSYDSKCDIWSFGCLVFEMLTGQLPFDIGGSLNSYCNDGAPFPGLRIKKAGASLLIARFVWTMLQAEPQARPTAEQAMFLLSYGCEPKAVQLLDSDTEPHLYLKDCVGRDFRIPWEHCSTWAEMMSSLRLALAYIDDDDVGERVLRGEFDLVTKDRKIIQDKEWSMTVRPGMQIFMRVRPEPTFATMSEPVPEAQNKRISEGQVKQKSLDEAVLLGREVVPEQRSNVVPPIVEPILGAGESHSIEASSSYDTDHVVVPSVGGTSLYASSFDDGNDQVSRHETENRPSCERTNDATQVDSVLGPACNNSTVPSNPSQVVLDEPRTTLSQGPQEMHFIPGGRKTEEGIDISKHLHTKETSESANFPDGAAHSRAPGLVKRRMHLVDCCGNWHGLSEEDYSSWDSLTQYVLCHADVDPYTGPWIQRGHFDLLDIGSGQVVAPRHWEASVSLGITLMMRVWHEVTSDLREKEQTKTRPTPSSDMTGELPVIDGRYVGDFDLWTPAASPTTSVNFSDFDTSWNAVLKFTDCFAKDHEIPFAQFRHWTCMRSFINTLWTPTDDYTRGDHIRNSYFDLFSMQLRATIPVDKWEALVRPGMHIYMLVWPSCEQKLRVLSQRNLRLLSKMLAVKQQSPEQDLDGGKAPSAFGSGRRDRKKHVHFDTNGSQSGFTFSNPEDIFEQFMKERGRGGISPVPSGPQTPAVSIITKTLPVTLEDLYKGTKKKMKVNRMKWDAKNRRVKEDKILEMDIPAGVRAGYKFKFSGVGDETDHGFADLHFIVSEKAHPDFEREGDNLRTMIELDLDEAATRWERIVKTIDGKLLPVRGWGRTAPGTIETFPGLGMPVRKKPGERGDLIVEIKIKQPDI